MAKQRRRFRRTIILSIGLAGFLAGLGLARLKMPVSAWWLVISVVLLVIGFKRQRWLAILGLTGVGLLLGLMRGSTYLNYLQDYQELYRRPVILQARASSDAVYADNGQLSFDVTNLQLVEPYPDQLVGKLAIKGYGTNAVYKGDQLQIEGKLRTTLGARQGTISYAEILLVERPHSLIDDIRRRFSAGMQTALPEPLASFALGILVGQRNTLPEITNEQLSAVGLTHIVAVSGYNLTIIIQAVRRGLKGFSKYQGTMLSLALIGLFLLFAGSSPSIVRAAIVSVLSLVAWYYGRAFKPLLLILLAAALTAGVNPVYIWSDIGWYLSFLAFFGILMVGPQLHKRLYRKRKAGFIAQLVLECVAAQMMAEPLIMYIFGQISLISLPANVLIVPLVPLAMALSLVAGLAGMFLPLVAGWFAWPGRILLTYMLDLVGLMAKVPHALAHVGLKLWQLLVLYGVIVAMTFVLWHANQKRNRGKDDIINLI